MNACLPNSGHWCAQGNDGLDPHKEVLEEFGSELANWHLFLVDEISFHY